GIERLLLLLENDGVEIPEPERLTVYVAPIGEAGREKAFRVVSELRKAGIAADTDYMERGIKAQFKYADKINAKFVGVLGDSEAERGVIKLKDMSSGEEKDVPISAILNELKKL
ncbi:MAG: histidine--tRNA ligase, partial [Clostridia bacterium]|nr:histidine--tRNA ligase [Clostridia bacterium]